MKREYVKPVMESEEFVANEYVAACWEVSCTGYEASLTHGAHSACGPTKMQLENDPTFDWGIIQDKDGFASYEYPFKGNGYSGKINDVAGPHPVTVRNLTSAEHPNAS